MSDIDERFDELESEIEDIREHYEKATPDIVQQCIDETDFALDRTQFEVVAVGVKVTSTDDGRVRFDGSEMRALRESPWKINHIEGDGLVLKRGDDD